MGYFTVEINQQYQTLRLDSMQHLVTMTFYLTGTLLMYQKEHVDYYI